MLFFPDGGRITLTFHGFGMQSLGLAYSIAYWEEGQHDEKVNGGEYG
jgi:hypothetical protein